MPPGITLKSTSRTPSRSIIPEAFLSDILIPRRIPQLCRIKVSCHDRDVETRAAREAEVLVDGTSYEARKIRTMTSCSSRIYSPKGTLWGLESIRWYKHQPRERLAGGERVSTNRSQPYETRYTTWTQKDVEMINTREDLCESSQYPPELMSRWSLWTMSFLHVCVRKEERNTWQSIRDISWFSHEMVSISTNKPYIQRVNFQASFLSVRDQNKRGKFWNSRRRSLLHPRSEAASRMFRMNATRVSYTRESRLVWGLLELEATHVAKLNARRGFLRSSNSPEYPFKALSDNWWRFCLINAAKALRYIGNWRRYRLSVPIYRIIFRQKRLLLRYRPLVSLQHLRSLYHW